MRIGLIDVDGHNFPNVALMVAAATTLRGSWRSDHGFNGFNGFEGDHLAALF